MFRNLRKMFDKKEMLEVNKKYIFTKLIRDIRTDLVAPYVEGDVLDLGCGQASYLEICGNKINRYYGIEMNKDRVKILKDKYPDQKFFYKNLDEDKLDFDVNFDTIILVAVIEHLFNQKHVMQEIIKNMKKDSKLIITTPTPFGNDIVHVLGGMIGLFSKEAVADHIVIYNKLRFKMLAKEFNLKIEKYKKFEFGCNQLVIMSKS